MNKVISFPKADTPFQSCWLIIAKAVIINGVCFNQLLSKHVDLVEFLGGRDRLEEQSLEDLVVALAPSLRLSTAILQQSLVSANFHIPGQGRGTIVRHCEVCAAHNYHSSIFYNPLLEYCPVHQKELIVCQICSQALNRNGVLYVKALAGKKMCGHLNQLKQGRVPLVTLSPDDMAAFHRKGVEYQQWINEIEELKLGSVRNVFPQLNSARNLRASEYYFEFVESRIGLPFSMSYELRLGDYGVAPIDHHIGLINKPLEQSATKFTSFARRANTVASSCSVKSSCGSDAVKSLKSMRRYFFRAYIKKHRKCFRFFKSLNQGQLTKLNLSSVCCCTAAYCAWLVSISGAKTLPEYFNLRREDSQSEVFDRILSGDPLKLRQVLVTQYVSFFDAWGALETVNDSGKRYSRIVVQKALVANESFPCMNASFTVMQRESIGGTPVSQRSYIISPDFLELRSRARCIRCGSGGGIKILAEVENDLLMAASRFVFRLLDRECQSQTTLTLNIW